MTVSCPKGHASTEADFCSECGARIATQTAEAPPLQANGACPDCRTKRLADGGKFCELCGYNFETGAHGEIPTLSAAPVPEPEPVAAPAPAPVQQRWTVRITVDPALREAGSPDPPADWAQLSVDANRDSLLIGRSSQSRAIAPDISLDFDSAVSHRHALITRVNGSDWTIRDIGSSNGTRLNGQDLKAMEDVPLRPGDRVTVGHWTCLTLAREPESI